MFTPGEIEGFSTQLDRPMRALELRIMQDIVRRIKINGEITRAADWQINRLTQLGMAREDIQNAIKEALELDDKDVAELYKSAIDSGYARDKALYEAAGRKFIPFDENDELQQLISSVAAQTNETLRNITQSLGFAVRGADGKLEFKPVADYYQQTLDGAMIDIASGAFDYNTVLKRVVREMTNSGLRTADYATGWKNRVDVATRRAIMTGMSQLTAKVNEDNAEQLDTDWFEITWHSGARPSHWWGGKWYRKSDLEKICGLGTVEGLCGANCYHDYYPVIPGISEPSYTTEELEELNRKEKEPIEYNGKKYTKYEALQRQRRLETTMRAQRQEIKLLKEGGASEDDLINSRARYRGTSHEYAVFSEAVGLPQQRERVTIDGLGNIGQGKHTGGSGKLSPIRRKPIGAKIIDKVTDEERRELLSQKSVDISGESGIIESEVKQEMNLAIDKFTPCLEDTETGELVPTVYEKVNQKELSDLKDWNFNWLHKDLKDSEIYKLRIVGDETIQGLIAITDFKRDMAVYVNIAESAPHNLGKNKKFNGVGGHLFAIAAKISLEKGYGGFLFMDAKNIELVEHYKKTLGAVLLGRPHPYRMLVDDENAMKLLDIYTFEED